MYVHMNTAVLVCRSKVHSEIGLHKMSLHCSRLVTSRRNVISPIVIKWAHSSTVQTK
jgi:hypothetical protein